jgi:hypothetical protein
VHDAFAGHDADTTASVATSVVEEPGHENAVRVEEVVFGVGVPGVEAVVRGEGVLDLLQVAGWGDDALALQDRGDLGFAERVPFDREGAVDGADALARRSRSARAGSASAVSLPMVSLIVATWFRMVAVIV